MNLTIETLERILADEKENCQRKVNQGVLKQDLNQSLAALGAMEALDRVLFDVRLASNREEIGDSVKPRKLRIERRATG